MQIPEKPTVRNKLPTEKSIPGVARELDSHLWKHRVIRSVPRAEYVSE